MDASCSRRLPPGIATSREQELLQAVRNLFIQRGYFASIALADTFSAAWAMARFGPFTYAHDGPSPSQYTLDSDASRTTNSFRFCASPADTRFGPAFFVPEGDTLTALLPLPIEALRLKKKTIETLHCLGIQTAAQLWALPRAELPSRFDGSLLERMDQATGELAESLPAFRTSPALSVQMDLERPTDRRDLLARCFQEMVDSLCTRMKEQNRLALRITCSLVMEDHSCSADQERVYQSKNPSHASTDNATEPRTDSVTIGLFQPTCDAKRLVDLLGMQWERRTILHPVTTLELTVTTSVRADPARAQWLPGMEDAASEQSVTSTTRQEIGELIEHLSCRLGAPAVRAARLTSEPQVEDAYQTLQLAGGDWIANQMPPTHRHKRSHSSPRLSRSSTATAIARHRNTANARPLHVFTPPIKLHYPARPWTPHANGSAPDRNPGPTSLRHEGHTYAIARRWGPERIETNWWKAQLTRRDYYRLEDEHGNHWWVYHDLRENAWYLQGTFD